MKTLRVLTATMLLAVPVLAADDEYQTEMKRLKEARDKAVAAEEQRIDTMYTQRLRLLLQRAKREGNSEAARQIQELLPPPPTTTTPAPGPAPQKTQVGLKKEPRSYVSKTTGSTGFKNINNKYVFAVESIGTKATVHYWGAGGEGNDTYGKVCLIHPSGREVEIGSWSPDDLPKSVDEVSSWKRLPEKAIDVTEHMTDPGEYTVAFRYTGGRVAFQILRVELVIE